MPYTIIQLTSKAHKMLQVINSGLVKCVSPHRQTWRKLRCSFSVNCYDIDQRFSHDYGKVKDSRDPYQSPRRSDDISFGHSIRIIGIASWYALKPEEMLREKCEINPDEYDNELNLGYRIINFASGEYVIPEGYASENSENGAYR